MKDQVRATEKAMRSNKRAAADSSSDENSRANKTNKKRKKGKDNKSKSSRTTAHGTARYCAELCKRAGMPYGKYSSHSTSQCKDAAEMNKAKLSGSYKDQSPPSPTTAHAAPPRPPQPRHISPRVRKVSPPMKTPHRLPRVGPNTKTIPSNRPTIVLQFKSLDPS